MKNTKVWIIIAGLAGFTGVTIGAFGAHGLKNIVSPESMEIYKTGVMYHLIHAVAILAIAICGNTKFFKSALFFLIGIILFSFSLYLYAVTQVIGFAIITPFGGVSFLVGWFLLIIEGWKNSKQE